MSAVGRSMLRWWVPAGVGLLLVIGGGGAVWAVTSGATVPAAEVWCPPLSGAPDGGGTLAQTGGTLAFAWVALAVGVLLAGVGLTVWLRARRSAAAAVER